MEQEKVENIEKLVKQFIKFKDSEPKPITAKELQKFIGKDIVTFSFVERGGIKGSEGKYVLVNIGKLEEVKEHEASKFIASPVYISKPATYQEYKKEFFGWKKIEDSHIGYGVLAKGGGVMYHIKAFMEAVYIDGKFYSVHSGPVHRKDECKICMAYEKWLGRECKKM